MLTNSVVKMAHKYAASKEAFEKATQIMCTEVSIPCSGRYNSLYDEEDLHRSLTMLSIGNMCAEAGMERLALEASTRVPSGSWVRDTAEKVPEWEIKEKVEKALSSTLEQIKAFKLFSLPMVGAIDVHRLPRYDVKVEPFLTRSKRDKGTSTFETYATLQCVEEGRRSQICCEPVGFFDDKEDVVEKLLIQSRLEGIEIALLLLDRGFFTSSTIRRLKKLHQTFLMPCILTPGIKHAIHEREDGKRGSISEYVMGSGEEQHMSFTLVILPKPGYEKEGDPSKKYLPLATNLPQGKILWNIRRLPRDYRMRWGIETGYVGIEQFRARTTSRNHTLRLLYFYYALILYNAWLLANLILAKSISRILSKPLIPIELLKGVFHRLITQAQKR